MREMSARTSYSIVRLVFRPYTHIWQTICTSVLLRTSSRVSPAFILHKYSSPSFGSQHIDYKWHPSKRLTFDAFGYASHSWKQLSILYIYFHCEYRFWITFILAHMLYSLVRVTRRDKKGPHSSIATWKTITSFE